jgi:hypothetical protein
MLAYWHGVCGVGEHALILGRMWECGTQTMGIGYVRLIISAETRAGLPEWVTMVECVEHRNAPTTQHQRFLRTRQLELSDPWQPLGKGRMFP